MIDGQCLETQPGYLDSPPAPTPPAGMSKESATVNGIMDKVVRKGKLFTKRIPIEGGWTILSGRGT
jgi:hypothetical protein